MANLVPRPQAPDLSEVLAQLQAQLAALSERLDRLEAGAAPPAPAQATAPAAEPTPAPAQAAAPAPARTPEAPGLTEEQILAVSAALGAFLGVRLRIRQIRLLSSPAWAQQGRVSIQASHRLHS